MTEREGELARQTIVHFSQERRRLKQEIEQLWQANAELRVERDATDLLLGQAIALLREYAERQW